LKTNLKYFNESVFTVAAIILLQINVAGTIAGYCSITIFLIYFLLEMEKEMSD